MNVLNKTLLEPFQVESSRINTAILAIYNSTTAHRSDRLKWMGTNTTYATIEEVKSDRAS